MNAGCIPLATLQRVGALPEGHVGRAHLDRCERCRSMLRLLREFESTSPGAAEDPAALEARLEAIVDQLLNEPAAPAAARVLQLPARRRRGTPGLGVAVRALAAAGILVGTLVIAALLRNPGPGAPGVLSPAPPPGNREPTTLPDGSRLSWSPVEGAEEYRVLVYDRGMTEIACVGPVRETTLVLGLGALPATVQPGDTLLWRVEALTGPDVLRRSPTRTVEAR